jgi:uncharacterized RDD family membrane protein YckC
MGHGAGGGYGYETGRDPRLAEPWRRFVGWLIDAVIVGVVGAAFWIPGAMVVASRATDFANRYPNSGVPGYDTALAHLAEYGAGIFVATAAAVVVLDILYYWLLTGLWGTTVGKRAVGAWVISTASWQKPGMGAAFVRSLIFVLGPAIFAIFFIIDNIWLLWDHQRQCLHDKAAGTIVVKGHAIGKLQGLGRHRAPGITPGARFRARFRAWFRARVSAQFRGQFRVRDRPSQKPRSSPYADIIAA